MRKRLTRSRKNRMIFGVCGGIAEYLDIDPVIVRLIFLFFWCNFIFIYCYGCYYTRRRLLRV